MGSSRDSSARRRGRVLVATLAGWLAGCTYYVPYTHRPQTILVPEDEELELGVGIYGDVLAVSTVSVNEPQLALVREVGERLAAVSERPQLAWEFTLVEADEAEAVALPGGKVLVYSGMLPVAEDTAGLAAVLGHEIAHVLARHGAERMTQRMFADAFVSALAGPFGIAYALPAALGFSLTSELGYVLPFSREHEREADRIGLMLMAKAGYDPQQAIAFWARFQGTQNLPELIASHPNPESRLADLQTWLPEAEGYFAAAEAAPVRELDRSSRRDLRAQRAAAGR